ncbi:MAG TPA: Clp protease N-terminal domain-containing protein [Candidatus Dormibacteraeota bacterium]|nr:Clp protease N-terminal domain-containing protein [Candidatus Dormibacteraeota bacterium]
MPESITRDARDILERAKGIASARGGTQVEAGDVLKATLQLPGSLADREIRALGVDPKAIAANLPIGGSADGAPPLPRLLSNANHEAEVLGHHQVDSIHLLLAMLYTDSPATAVPLQTAGLTLYDLRTHLQTGSKQAAARLYAAQPPDQSLRRQPWPSLRGVIGVSPVFLAIAGVTAAAGLLLWANTLPRLLTALTLVFVAGGWIASLCIHEFGHALVAYLGGDRSVVGEGYLTLDPLRYTNVTLSLVLPIVFLLIGGVALPGGAVYINHSALRSRAWSSAVSIAGPVGSGLCALLVAAVFTLAQQNEWVNSANLNFFAALAYLGFFLILAAFLNVLPVPGLDGFGIIRPWLPYEVQYAAMRYSMLSIFAVFALLWFVPPVREAFFGTVFQIAAALNIDPILITFGSTNMRFF